MISNVSVQYVLIFNPKIMNGFYILSEITELVNNENFNKISMILITQIRPEMLYNVCAFPLPLTHTHPETLFSHSLLKVGID